MDWVIFLKHFSLNWLKCESSGLSFLNFAMVSYLIRELPLLIFHQLIKTVVGETKKTTSFFIPIHKFPSITLSLIGPIKIQAGLYNLLFGTVGNTWVIRMEQCFFVTEDTATWWLITSFVEKSKIKCVIILNPLKRMYY